MLNGGSGAINDFEPNSSAGGVSGPSLKFIRKSELSQEIFSNRSVISINQQSKEVSFKYGASEGVAAQIAAQINFSMTAPPQKNNLFEMQILRDGQMDSQNSSVKESLMNTQKNPIITPTPPNYNEGNQRTLTEQEPFQVSDCASNIVPASDKGSAQNLLSSHFGSSYKSQNNLSQLLWQLPYPERKSILQQQQRVIEVATEQEMAASEDLGDNEINES